MLYCQWLSASRLGLNPAKTLIIWLGGTQQVTNVAVHTIFGSYHSSMIATVASARDHGIADSQLIMSAMHLRYLCRSAYYQLRHLRPVSLSLSVDVPKSLSRRLCHHAWTAATSYVWHHRRLEATASGSPECRDTNWSPVLRSVTTSLEFSSSFIGFSLPAS